jgi:tetratricopeptide (TPR) repeat protein
MDHSVERANDLVRNARATGWSPLIHRALRHAANAERWADQGEAAIAHLREASVEAGRSRNTAAALDALTEIAFMLAEFDKPSDALVVIADAEVMAQSDGDQPWVRGRIEGARGRALGKLSRHAESDAAYEAAIRACRAAPEPDELYVGRLLVDRAEVLKEWSKEERAKASLLEAQQLFNRLLGPMHPALAAMHMTLGNVLLQLKDIPGGKAEHAKALAILESRYTAEHPNVIKARFAIGMAAIHESRLDDAVAAFEITYHQLAKIQPEADTTYKALYMLATAKLEQGRYAEARPLYEQVLTWRLANLGDAHVSTANVLDALGKIYQAQDDYPAAQASMARALAIREKALGADSPDVASSLQGLASLELDRGGCAEAVKHARRALAILDRVKAEPHTRIDSVLVLAECDARAGKLTEAKAQFETLLAMVDVPDAATIEQRTNARTDFAEALYKLGDRARARKLVQEAIDLYTGAGRKDDAAEHQAWLAKHP